MVRYYVNPNFATTYTGEAAMTKFSLLKPLDQPNRDSRLLSHLVDGLENPDFNRLNMIVAYAKSGPFIRLDATLQQWRARGGLTYAIFGVDQQGTSLQALEMALRLFDEVSVLRVPRATFHPKMYWFQGDSSARAFVGSPNFTVGGTEVNFEAATRLDLNLPDDSDDLAEFTAAWEGLSNLVMRLDNDLLERLVAEHYVVDEKRMRRNAGGGDGSTWGGGLLANHGFAAKPPSPLPAPRRAAVNQAMLGGPIAQPDVPANRDPQVQGFALQIRPHHNGEVFLSVQAVRQNPEFFGWPFTGQSTPRASDAAPYPHRDPTPVVNIRVYGPTGAVVYEASNFQLTTVYYESRSEVRVTSIGISANAPEFSIMVMELSDDDGVDYGISVYHPESPQYADWLRVCSQRMPGGGTSQRSYGWF